MLVGFREGGTVAKEATDDEQRAATVANSLSVALGEATQDTHFNIRQ